MLRCHVGHMRLCSRSSLRSSRCRWCEACWSCSSAITVRRERTGVHAPGSTPAHHGVHACVEHLLQSCYCPSCALTQPCLMSHSSCRLNVGAAGSVCDVLTLCTL